MSDRARVLGGWASRAARHPRAVLAICTLLAALGGVSAVLGLEFRSDRSALVDPDLDWQQRYRAFKERFPRWDDALVVVDGPAGDALRFFEALEARLGTDERFTDHTLWFDPNAAHPRALLLEDLASLRGTLDALRSGVIETPDRALFPVGDGELYVGFVALDNAGGAGVNDLASTVGALRGHVRTARERLGAPIDVGITGVPVMEVDETERSTLDAALASSLSFVLIALLLARVYRGVLVPLCALGALLLGVAWSFGWVVVGVGHLQVLSVVFAVFLLGLGVDSAIHLIARLELVHPDHDHMPGAVGEAVSAVGPGIVTGTLTTGVAFGATALSPFTGVAEMGLIASGGVVLCTIAILSALPALLALLPRPERTLRTRAGGASRPFGGAFGLWIDRHPAKVLSISVAALVLAVLSATGVVGAPIRYDPDLLALMPPNAEGVVWEERLRGADERSSWHAVVVADDASEAASITRALAAHPLVAHVGGAGVLFVPDDTIARRRALIAEFVEDETVDALVRQGIGGALGGTVRASDLSPSIGARFVTEDGGYVLRVFPAPVGDLGPLEPDRLAPFVEGVLSIAPGATGPSVQVYESTRVILRGYELAALYAAIAILVLLLIDFRNLADALCAALPVLVGFALLLGVMATFGIALNFANTIVLPLIIGLGVDAGVHALHRWRTQPGDAPAGLAGGTGRAITLTTLTTAIGFACMTIGEHRGVRSLGIVMTLGLVLVWCASVFVLPPILRLRSSASARGPASAP